jgi:uncharacterized coiled-coil protein SlyX
VDEREQAPRSAGGHELASEVGDRVRSIISAAEAAANAVRHEAEQEGAVRRRVAEEEARRIIEDAKADADAHLAERIRRISELSDTVVERAETIVSRLDRAEEVRQQLQTLADALGESAERLAGEVRVGSPPPMVRSPGSAPAAEPGASSASRVAPPDPAAQPGAQPAAPAGREAGAGASADETRPPSFAPRGPVTGEAPAPAAPDAPPLGAPSRDAPPAPAEGAPADPGHVGLSDEAHPFGDTPPPFTPAAERGDLPLAGPPPSTRRRTAEDEAEGVPDAAAAAEPEVAETDVVRIERREPPEPEPRPATDRREADQQLGARLVALQMAVAGGNRGEVEVHLRRTFDLADPAPILDDIFGLGTESDKRVAWPRDATA